VSRPAVLSVAQLRDALVLDAEACQFGVNSPARHALEQERAEAEAARQREHEAQMKHLHSLATSLRAAADELAARRKALIEEVQPQAVRLAIAIAGRLVMRELETDAPVALAAAREALQGISSADVVRIRLNPNDRERLADALRGELGGDGVEITADGSVGRGGCVVDTRFGTIDATIDTRWAKMVAALTGKRERDDQAKP
jgi:flagellar assembly protein FliH